MQIFSEKLTSEFMVIEETNYLYSTTKLLIFT